jgi:PEP-CTERM motif
MSLGQRLSAVAFAGMAGLVSSGLFAPSSAMAVTVVQGDFSTAADLPFCCARVGARTTSVAGAAVGAGVELQNQGLNNPSSWLGGEVWVDLNPTTWVLTLTAKDGLDYQTFSARVANLQFDTAGAFVSGISLLSNGLVTGGLVPTLGFTGNSVSVDYSTAGSFNFVNGGTARFQLDIDVDSLASMPAVTPIPEPSTYALMALGLAAVGFAARKKRADAAAPATPAAPAAPAA